MRDFSIDIESEKIYSPKTREYFKEVVKSYFSESYRSAIVMLYSIVVVDLIYKIEDLKDIYEDKSAIEILNKITDIQKRVPNSPEWESKLIELIKEKTSLLEGADYNNITSLQKCRHLCAHPVLTQNSDLYSPNKETTRSHMRNMLEGVLTKPPFLSRKILEDFLDDLANVKTILIDDIQLNKYLNSRYLDRISPSSLKSIFKSLWKITFRTEDKQCDEHRDINLRALVIIANNKSLNIIQIINSEKNYYSNVSTRYLPYVISFLNYYPKVFDLMSDSANILIQNEINKDVNLYATAIFFTMDIEKHIVNILDINWDSCFEKKDITPQSIIDVFSRALTEGRRDLAYNFLIKMFGKSNQYDIADSRFDNLIKPYIDSFNEKELKLIVEQINGNAQIYGRRKARETNRLIKNKIDEVNDKFDFSEYSNFNM